MLRLLKRAKADSKTLVRVYISCIRPILKRAYQIWYHRIPEYSSKDIERIKRRALKTIHPSLSYQEVLTTCNIPTLRSRRKTLCRSFFEKKVLPGSSILSSLVEIADNSGYDVRAPKKLLPF